MRILALEPYYGGSHRALLDGWASRSRHGFELITLPARHWRWRMRHAPVTIADQVQAQASAVQSWDAIWCSSMLGLAELRGLLPPSMRTLPAVVYFHENQLAYPLREDEPRDLHFAFTHLTTALAADGVWFNSAFNRDTLLGGLTRLLAQMPDYRSPIWPAEIAAKCRLRPPGIAPVPRAGTGARAGPLRILWAARWEHDKAPERLFEALLRLQQRGLDFRVSVLGQRFEQEPEVFLRARRKLAPRIDRWGYQTNRADYETVLLESDVIVSTADQEFFGLAVMEAVSAGCVPVLPDRLVYPELFPPDALYDGSVNGLVRRLAQLIQLKATSGRLDSHWIGIAQRYDWARVAPEMDAAMDEVVVGPVRDR